MVPRWARAQCSHVRLAKGRESLGGQRLADILILGCEALVHDGTKRLLGLTILEVVPTSKGHHEGQLLRGAKDQHKIVDQVGLAVVPRQITIGQQWCCRNPVVETTTEGRGHYSQTTKSKADELYPEQHRCSFFGMRHMRTVLCDTR